MTVNNHITAIAKQLLTIGPILEGEKPTSPDAVESLNLIADLLVKIQQEQKQFQITVIAAMRSAANGDPQPARLLVNLYDAIESAVQDQAESEDDNANN